MTRSLIVENETEKIWVSCLRFDRGCESHGATMPGKYDLIIVGGGISDASLLYTTAKFTDIDSIALIEKESEIAAINSHHTNNSQTLHFGDIETNYTIENAEEVKEGAELLAGYLEHHDPDREMHAKRSEMVLGVGEGGVSELERRYDDEGLGELFPKLRPIGRERIAELEPAVVEGRDTRRLPDFLDGDYAFDEAAFRAATIGNFPRGGSVGPTAATADEATATDD